MTKSKIKSRKQVQDNVIVIRVLVLVSFHVNLLV